MISSIGGMTPQMIAPPTQSLSEEQETGLQDILSNYDTDNISDEDAAEIVSGIQELGIQPGKALGDALGTAGINARDLASQAGIAPKGPPPPGGPGGGQGGGQTGGVNEAAVEVLESVLEALESDELTSADEFQAYLQEQLEEAGLDPTASLVDIRL